MALPVWSYFGKDGSIGSSPTEEGCECVCVFILCSIFSCGESRENGGSNEAILLNVTPSAVGLTTLNQVVGALFVQGDE